MAKYFTLFLTTPGTKLYEIHLYLFVSLFADGNPHLVTIAIKMLQRDTNNVTRMRNMEERRSLYRALMSLYSALMSLYSALMSLYSGLIMIEHNIL